MRRLLRVLSSEAARFALAGPLQGATDRALLVAATRRAADELVWDYCPRGALGIQRFTLWSRAAQLAAPALASRRLTPLTPLAAEAVAARSIFELRQKTQLPYFAPVVDTPGFVRAMSRTVRELRLHRVAPSQLRRAPAASTADLGALLERFVEICNERQLADEAAVLSLAEESVASGAGAWLTELPLLWLDAPVTDPSAAALLATVVKQSPLVVAAVLEHDLETLVALQGLLGVSPEPGDRDGDSSLRRARRYLFGAETAPVQAADHSLQYFAAPGESLECVEMARWIQQATAAGLPFDRMAIPLRDPNYQPHAEEALRRAGIPAYFSRGAQRPDPAGRAFLALLHCAADHLSASSFAEYLSLAQVPDPAAAGSEPQLPALEEWLGAEAITLAPETPDQPAVPAPHLWERLLVDAAVRYGADRWSRRLAGLLAELNLQRGQVTEQPEQIAALDRRIEQLENLQRFALPLIARLAALPVNALWRDWLPRLDELAVAALRQPFGVRQVLRELEPMAGIGPVDLGEVIAVLAERLGTLRAEPPARRYDRVFVAPIAEARGLCFDLVFLPGLAEGIFPRRAGEDPLFLDELRQAVDPRLPTRRTETQRERLQLRIALGAGQRVVFSYPSFSYPTMDTALGRARVPSLYALDLLRAALGELLPLSEIESAARRNSAARLGWPAPTHPADAIAQTEFDLAVHGALNPQAPQKGLGRFLIANNDHAARSLRALQAVGARGVERRRRTLSGLGGAPGTAGRLAAHRAGVFTKHAPAVRRLPVPVRSHSCPAP